MELKTPLYDTHVAGKARIVPFAGYLLPVQYTQVIAEHQSVRQAAGLFDVSHMGEIMIEGPEALAFINYLLANDFTSLADGRVRYSTMCNDAGGIVDDLVVYRMAADRYMLVVNGANHDKDLAWILEHRRGDVRVTDISEQLAQVALQGPKSREILARVMQPDLIPEKYYSFREHCHVAGMDCLVSQTGYTGELGYELYCTPADAACLWQSLLAAGSADGLVPCGLGARDTLRLEAAMPLYGHEMTDTISPIEAGLQFSVKMDKPDFIGKQALLARGEPAITRVGLKVTGSGIVREHCAVYAGDRQVGETTSGTFCPTLQGAYAMALVDKAFAAVGTGLEAEVRGRRIAMAVVPLPFYKRK